uniref:Uncharacterized protein n=1 Tax=Physcomitrium patens TaxID=3218 RepID=A0A7I3ZRU9_PHYPA
MIPINTSSWKAWGCFLRYFEFYDSGRSYCSYLFLFRAATVYLPYQYLTARNNRHSARFSYRVMLSFQARRNSSRWVLCQMLI